MLSLVAHYSSMIVVANEMIELIQHTSKCIFLVITRLTGLALYYGAFHPPIVNEVDLNDNYNKINLCTKTC